MNKKLIDEAAELEQVKRQREEEEAKLADLRSAASAAKSPRRKSSMFSDIKEMLKAVEYTKKQIENESSAAAGGGLERDPKTFYTLSGSGAVDSERARMKKLVDGCISAISNDVKVRLDQKLTGF